MERDGFCWFRLRKEALEKRQVNEVGYCNRLNLNQSDARERKTCYRLYLHLNKYLFLRRIRTRSILCIPCLRTHQNRPTFLSTFSSPFRIQNRLELHCQFTRALLSNYSVTLSICRNWKVSNQHVLVHACQQRLRLVAHKCFASNSHAKENPVLYTKPKMTSRTYLAC